MKVGKAAHKALNGLRAAVLCVTAVVVVQQAAVSMAADWSSGATRHAVSKWGSGEASFTAAQWDSALQDLTRALALTPHDATLHDALAQLHAAKGRSLWTTGAEDSPEVEAYLAAEQHQEASVQLRPTHAMAWANLALIRLAVYADPDALYQAWREAARLGPKELAVENTLVTIATETWSTAPADVRQWVEIRRPGISEKQEARQNKSGGL